MSKGKEIRSRLFARSPHFGYLPAEDRYMFIPETPRHRFNVIGAGANGSEHVRVTCLEGRATIHGMYDPNPGSVGMAQVSFAMFNPGKQLKVYDSLEAACLDPEVDGLIISTPNYTHLEVLRVAARSGKHIFLEKPMATTVADAYEITQIAAGHPAVLQIGLQYRYKSQYVEAIHEALERKSLGEIKLVSILEHRVPFMDKVTQWNKFARFSGGTLVEKCCHYFDLLNMFAGSRPVSVFASGGMAVNFKEFEYHGERSDILDHAFVTVNYANGVRASFSLCMFAPMFYEELVICGDDGRLFASEMEDFLDTGRPKARLEVICGESRPSRISTPAYPAQLEQSGHNGATFFEHLNFIDNIEGRETNAATPADGFWSVVVGAAAEESVKTGKVVEIEAMLAAQGVPAAV